jgi:uncharacterized protein YjbI with pentapeptide repeats
VRSIAGYWIAFGVVASLALVAAFFALPALMVPADIDTTVDRLKAEHDVRIAGIQTVTVIAALGGSVLTALTIDTNRKGQIADRFAKAVDMLSSGSEGSRIAGIYALDRVIMDARDERDAIVGLLAANVRRESPAGTKAPPPPPVRSTLEVLRTSGVAELDLAGTNLRGTVFDRSKLRGAKFNGTDLTDGRLRGADLRGAKLVDAVLHLADLDDVDLRDAFLQGAQMQRATLRRADLRGADLSGTNLCGANLTGAHVDRGQLLAAEVDGATVLPDGTRAVDPAP